MKNRPKIILSISSTFCLGFLRGQSKFLKDNGFDVYLFSPAGEGLVEYGQSEGCNIVEIPYKREISLFSDLKCLILTLKHFHKIKPDIINVGTPKSGLIGVLAARILGIENRIFTLRGLRSTAEPEGRTKKIVEFMEKFTHDCANYVISISPSMANYAIDNNILNEKKTVVLAKASSNGINVDKFALDKDKSIIDKLKEEFSINNNDFVIGFVGRVVKSKGVEEIYKAFTSLSVRYDNLKMLVIGPIEDTSDSISLNILESMKANKNVVFTGQRKDVDYLYHLMTIFSLPSHNFREGFGNVAMEASASGIPIVVSRGAGCQDAILDGQTGILVDPMSVSQLDAAFEYYIKNRNIVIEHGLNGRKFATKFFKNEIIWNAQLEFYKELMNIKK